MHKGNDRSEQRCTEMVPFKYDQRHKDAAKLVGLVFDDYVCDVNEMRFTQYGREIPYHYHIAPKWFVQIVSTVAELAPRRKSPRKAGPARTLTPDDADYPPELLMQEPTDINVPWAGRHQRGVEFQLTFERKNGENVRPFMLVAGDGETCARKS